MANWNNSNHKAENEERQTLPLTTSLTDWSRLSFSFIAVEFIKTFFTIFPLLQDKQNILTVIRVYYFMEKNSLSSELSNVAHGLKLSQRKFKCSYDLPSKWNKVNHWQLSIDWISLDGVCIRTFLRRIQHLIEMNFFFLKRNRSRKYIKTLHRVLWVPTSGWEMGSSQDWFNLEYLTTDWVFLCIKTSP